MRSLVGIGLLLTGVLVPLRARWPREGRPARLFLVVRRATGELLHRWPVLRTDEEVDDVMVGLTPGDYVAELETPEGRVRSTPFAVDAKASPVLVEGPGER